MRSSPAKRIPTRAEPSRTSSRRSRTSASRAATATRALERAKRKFLRAFPLGFRDETYIDWERAYKWNAHIRWQEQLSEPAFRRLLEKRQFEEIARLASAIESRTNLLFSFEKMALRDAIRSFAGAQDFATALYDLLHGSDAMDIRFASWIAALDRLPRKQTRVLTWPLATVFGFIAQPKEHFFLKPTVTREALRRCDVAFAYESRPNWPVYRELLAAVRTVRNGIAALRPRDMIDMQSFLWVQGSDEYPD
jgi:hypothetical protein